MHELSIANAIVESVAGVIAAEREAVVAAVHVRVGAMSGVVVEALEFAWSAATPGTRLDGSRLEIEYVPAVAWCPSCATEVELPGFNFSCPLCGTPTPGLVRGRELEILSVEVSDEQQAAHS